MKSLAIKLQETQKLIDEDQLSVVEARELATALDRVLPLILPRKEWERVRPW